MKQLTADTFDALRWIISFVFKTCLKSKTVSERGGKSKDLAKKFEAIFKVTVCAISVKLLKVTDVITSTCDAGVE